MSKYALMAEPIILKRLLNILLDPEYFWRAKPEAKTSVLTGHFCC